MSVYFIRVGRYIKVGYSQNPERRCANLFASTTRYSRPLDLSIHEPRELLLVIPGTKEREKQVHGHLSDFAAGTEWFIDEPAVREYMARAAKGRRSRVTRNGGQFVAAGLDDILPERLEENARLLEKFRRNLREGAISA